MKRIFTLVCFGGIMLLASCHFNDGPGNPHENSASFQEIGQIILEGGEGAAEISAFDPKTKKLFVTNATRPAIDVIDLSDPPIQSFWKLFLSLPLVQE